MNRDAAFIRGGRWSLFILKPVVLVLRVVTTVAFLAVPALLLVGLIPFLEGSGSYPFVNRVVAFDAMLIDAVRHGEQH